MLLPTLKEDPADADVISQKLMMRAGMIRKVAAGIYNLLPMGLKVVRKVEAIVREEMDRAGAQELSMPVVIPSELWRESGRWDVYGKELLRVKDRHDRDFCLGPTHEEVITALIRGSVRSYRDLPMNLYQIQTKFRDEIRPRFGLMRGREFTMKDAYSFHTDDECAECEYMNMFNTYTRIFERCGLEFRAVEAETGAIGGRFSHEFHVLAETGEDEIASCDACSYAANTERAETRKPGGEGAQGEERPIEKISTPGMKSIEDVSGYLKTTPATLIKTLIYNTDKGVVAALVRGDTDLNEMKLRRVVDAEWVELAGDDMVKDATGAPTGFAGPVGLKIPVFADYNVMGITAGVTGANEADAHIKNVSPARDFQATYADLRMVVEGDLCPRCDGKLSIRRGIEVGHIFKLGTKYSTAMGALFLDENGVEQPMIMGCYGIGIGRTAAASIEQNHDDGGIVWPKPLAPFLCEVLPVSIKNEPSMTAAEQIYDELISSGIDTLLDDRDERAGVKFKDADLIGIPVRVVVGERNLKDGNVEIKERAGGEARLVKLTDAVSEIKTLLNR
jgi:prolyl-tRNA synthetase